MALSADDYLQQLQALLPTGPVWPRRPDAVLTRVLAGLAPALARVDERAADLAREAVPSTASELLADWLRLADAPDRDSLLATLTATGGATPEYFIGLAAAMGLAISITAPLAGVTPDFTVNSTCIDALIGDNGAFHWQVSVAAPAPQPALEALFKRLKPAHTRVFFIYQE